MTNRYFTHLTLIKYMSSHLPIFLASRSLYKDNRSIHHEDIKVINIQVLRITTSKYMKHMLIELCTVRCKVLEQTKFKSMLKDHTPQPSRIYTWDARVVQNIKVNKYDSLH